MPVSRSLTTAACAAGMVLLLSGCGPEDAAGAAPTPAAVPPPDVVTVTNVVDGDTFGVSDGRTVRVLGIDSCEAGTDAGRDATTAATGRLLGVPVTLTVEPGSDRDPYDRVLRYVRTPDGQDFGKAMVPSPHTGIYDGGGAAAAYVTELRSLDSDGRSCDRPEPAPTTTSTPPPVVVQDDDDRPYVPAPAGDDARSGEGSGPSDDGSDGDSDGGSATKPRSGQSGHPCLPGERDGDNDGYCGEGR